MRHDFEQDYATLELNSRADWDSAQLSYRRLVHRWHPDRHRLRARERVHAQQRFIAITQAFNTLRSYYRTHHRLPMEPIRTPRGEPTLAVNPGRGPGTSAMSGGTSSDPRTASATAADIDEVSLLRSQPHRWMGGSRVSRTALVAVPIAGLIIGTLGFLFVLDRKAAEQHAQTARELTGEQPAQAGPSAREVQSQKNRGAFVENPAPGKLGDRLMKDLFRP